MMGRQDSGQAPLFYSFNLEDHVPTNHHLRGIDSFGKKANPPIDLAQPPFAVLIVGVFAAVAVAGGPRDDLHDGWPFTVMSYFDQEASVYFADQGYSFAFYGTPMIADVASTAADQAERLAGFLQHECGVRRGDRVALFLQNSPQFVIGFYAILRADAVAVPVNSMSLTHELSQVLAFVARRLAAKSVGLVLAVRESGGERHFDGLAELVVHGLDDASQRRR